MNQQLYAKNFATKNFAKIVKTTEMPLLKGYYSRNGSLFLKQNKR